MNIDERLEALTMNLELMSHSHEALVQKQAEDYRLLAQKQAQDDAKNERRHAKTENLLRRAIAAGVKEARSQRERSRILDEKITQISSAQLVSEEKIAQISSAQLVSEEKIAEVSRAQLVSEEKLTELAKSQEITQQLFQAWLKRGSNGKH